MKLFKKRKITGLFVALFAAIAIVAAYGFFADNTALSNNMRAFEKEITEQLDSHALVDMDAARAERSIGSADAPVTIFEYSSLSCGHCAAFHMDVLPEIKKNYVETGKVRIVFNEFPLNAPALRAAMMARCVAPERYYGLIDTLFRNQERWVTVQPAEFEKTLFQFSRLAGLTQEKFDACMVNRQLEDLMLESYQQGVEKWQISSTPTFVINGKEVVTGARDYNFFKNLIEAQLKAQ